MSRFAAAALLFAAGVACAGPPTDPAQSRAKFLESFATLRLGMTVEEVDRALAGSMKGSGWEPPSEMVSTWKFRIAGSPNVYQARVSAEGELELIGCTIYRHSDLAAYDSDWGIVCFANGRVSNLEFSYD